MIRKLKSVLTICTCLSALFSVTACTNSAETKPAITKSQHTTITPHMEQHIESAQNLLYCASFQMAWNRMRDQVVKGDIQLENDPLTAQRLNKKSLDNNDISSESYVAEAGELSQELVSRINREQRVKFGDQVEDGFSIPHETTGHREIVA